MMLYALVLAAMTLALFASIFFRPLTHLPFPYTADDTTMARCAAFDAWDNSRRTRNVFAGLRFLRPTNSRRTIHLAYRHWPHLLCWQWILALDIRPYSPAFAAFHRSGPGASGGESWTLRFLWLFCLRYQRQASDRIAALNGAHRDAPQVYPRDRLSVAA